MQSARNTLICLLIINKIEEMPGIALKSILNSTSENILIGYLNEADVLELPKSSRVTYVDLLTLRSISGVNPTSKYVDFSQEDFYKLVQYKWVLLDYAMTLKIDTVIFSDFDVYWHKSPIAQLNETFTSFPEINIQIQTYTSEPAIEKLCMGFVAIRNNPSAKLLLQRMSDLHSNALQLAPFTGDDNIISDAYNSDVDFRNQCRLLPQSTFPTGNLINTFASRNLFPGLIPYEPFIFHANFVVGSKKKVQLLRTFIFQTQFGSTLKYQRVITRFQLLIRRVGVFIKKLLS